MNQAQGFARIIGSTLWGGLKISELWKVIASSSQNYTGNMVRFSVCLNSVCHCFHVTVDLMPFKIYTELQHLQGSCLKIVASVESSVCFLYPLRFEMKMANKNEGRQQEKSGAFLG